MKLDLIQDYMDLEAIKEVHLQAFPESGLTRLGREAVRRYYHWQLDGPHESISLGVMVEGELAGFLIGGVFNGAMGGFLAKNRRYLIVRVITHPWILLYRPVRKQIILRVPALFQKKKEESVKPTPVKKRSYAVLSIGISPEFRRLGIGRMLMDAMIEAGRARDFSDFHLTVAQDNHTAISFYENLGWTKAYDGRADWAGKMVFSLFDQEAHSG